MKLLAITFGSRDHASSRTRVYLYRPGWERAGISVRVLPERPVSGSGFFSPVYSAVYKRLHRIRRVVALAAGRWEVIFVHRVFLSPIERRIVSFRKIPVIFDFDDAIFLQDARSRAATLAMIRLAKHVTVSAPGLEAFTRRENPACTVITTPADTAMFFPAEPGPVKETVTIGWTGSPSTFPYLKKLFPVLKSVAIQCPEVRFLFVGTGTTDSPVPGLTRNVSWSEAGEPELLRQMDIGIMPLPDDEWTRFKGGYKLFLYFSTGIPAVASPVGINREVILPGETGYLADTDKDWQDALIRLIRDPEERKTLGKNALSRAKALYSLDACTQQVITILETLHDHRR